MWVYLQTKNWGLLSLGLPNFETHPDRSHHPSFKSSRISQLFCNETGGIAPLMKRPVVALTWLLVTHSSCVLKVREDLTGLLMTYIASCQRTKLCYKLSVTIYTISCWNISSTGKLWKTGELVFLFLRYHLDSCHHRRSAENGKITGFDLMIFDLWLDGKPRVTVDGW